MHSYYTAQAQTHTCAEMELPLLKASWPKGLADRTTRYCPGLYIACVH